MVNHYRRAAANITAKRPLGESKHCSVEIDEWFPTSNDKKRFVDLGTTGMPKISQYAKSGKVEIWLSSQTNCLINRRAWHRQQPTDALPQAEFPFQVEREAASLARISR